MGYKKQNTTGRKRLSDEKRKKFSVWLNEYELRIINEKADAVGMNLSVYMRTRAMDYTPIIPDPEFRQELMRVRDDIKRLFSILDKAMTPEQRYKKITEWGFLRDWVKAVKKELRFINKWIDRT